MKRRRLSQSIRLRRLGEVLAVCIVSVFLNACGHSQAVTPAAVPMTSVMQTIRDYGRDHQQDSAPLGAVSQGLYDSDGLYQSHIAALFAQGDFAQIDREGRDARSSKARFAGGAWKLFLFYQALSAPGENPSGKDWMAQIATEKKWIAANPDSAAARIALAETYLNSGWAVRGSGYSDTVSDSGWKYLKESTEMAKAALLDAAKLKEKCPYWYESMQHVALAQGWEKRQARELLDQAAAFEPGFYHYYREYANFVLPKWYGGEGEQPAFADEMSKKLPVPLGSIVYFEIASLQACQCDPSRDSLEGFSWPRVKEGYAQMVRQYGTTSLKANRLAYMAYVAQDQAAAREAFLALGDSIDSTVWHSEVDFRRVKNWALAE